LEVEKTDGGDGMKVDLAGTAGCGDNVGDVIIKASKI